jgi:hypothetical protein
MKPYRLIDNCGTDMRFWTLNGAMAWLPYAGRVAVIGLGNKVIIERVQGSN